MKQSNLTKPEPLADRPVFAFHTHSNTSKVTAYPAGVHPFSTPKNIYLAKIFWPDPFDIKESVGDIEKGIMR